MRSQVPTLSSQSTNYIVVFRNGDQARMRAKYVGSRGQFSLVLSDGQHQRQQLALNTNGDGKISVESNETLIVFKSLYLKWFLIQINFP